MRWEGPDGLVREGATAEVCAALDANDPLENEEALSLDDLETIRELELWKPGHLWCEDTLTVLCPRGNGTYHETTDAYIATMLVTLNEARRVWGICQRNEATAEDDSLREGRAKQYVAHVKSASSATRIMGAANLFKKLRTVGNESLNVRPDVLGTPNGVVDMDTGELYTDEVEIEAVEEWGITKSTRANVESEHMDEFEYDERWDEFISQIMCGDEERASYLQRALGYSILGANPEECMFVAYGPTTRNGKGTLLNSVAHALGDYARASTSDFLLAKRQASGGTDETLASLAGARLVTISEPDEGRKLDESKVKELTGNDPQRTSKKYGHQFEFLPQFTMWMSCNRLPQVRDTSVFTSGRIRVIPFEAHFEGDTRDNSLKDRFRTKNGMATILTWLIEGFIEYRKRGLDEPESVRKATEAYATSGGSSVRRFVDSQCVLGNSCEVVTTDLHDAYKAWCEDTDEETPLSARKVAEELRLLAIGKRRDNKHRYYTGIRLSQQTETRLNVYRTAQTSDTKASDSGTSTSKKTRKSNGKTIHLV